MASANKRLVIVASMVVLMLYPFKKTLVPEQHVLVTTKDMHPIANASVRQSWQDYSLEFGGHEEDLPTDVHGRVTFPARTLRAPLIWRLLGPLTSIAGQGIHASFGVHTHMSPMADKDARVSTEVETRASKTVSAPNKIVGRERRERVSQLAWCGGGSFDLRRRVNSSVRRPRVIV